ncbi:MAG: MnmC family methyltransferase [Candidatus Omnitrophota bacterium]
MIITKKEWDIISNQKKDSVFELKLDFGLTKIQARKTSDKIVFGSGLAISLETKVKENFCYCIEGQALVPIAYFSEITNKFYKLTPTDDWPTISISSVPMHKLSSPKKDTEGKMELLKPYGLVLDTCMGPGYSAIMAANSAKKVITFEKDENILVIAKQNPLSAALFSKENIEVRMKDVSEGIKEFSGGYFDCITHDPPTFKLAPELFGTPFYKELYRVLKEKGRLFHYTPLYKVSHGYDFPSKIKKKLIETGFKFVDFSKDAGGILCTR